MATVTPTSALIDFTGKKGHVYTWASIGDSDTCTSVGVGPYDYATVVVSGTFSSQTVVLKGSLDNTNFFGLSNQAGTAISKTAAGGGSVHEKVLYFQPLSSGGSSSATTVKLYVVGQG